MMKKTHTITLVSALALSLLFVGSASAANMGGGQGERNGEKGEHLEGIHAAVEANDYTQLSVEAQEKISEEKFTEMVSKYAEKAENKAKLESVVAANDFDGFKALKAEHKAEMEAHKAEMEEKAAAEGKEMKERADRSEKEEREEPTEEEMRTHFDEIVAYYNENGELPEMDQKNKKMNKTKANKMATVGKKARKGGGLTDGQKDRVQTIVDRVDNERLETILEKIASKIETIEAGDFDEERTAKILEILETIQAMIEAKLG